MKRWSLGVSALTLLISTVAHGQASGYFLDRMPTINGATFSPVGITDTGEIGGTASISGGFAADIVKNGAVRKLQGIGVNNAPVNNYLMLSGINSAGSATGSGITGQGYSTAIYWDPQGNPWELVGPEWDNGTGYSAGGADTVSYDIDEHGTSVGSATSYRDGPAQVAMMWRGAYPSDAIQLETGLPQSFLLFDSEQAVAISRNGEMIAGYGSYQATHVDCQYDDEPCTYYSPSYAEMWKGGKLVMLQENAAGYGINDSGTMVGVKGVEPNPCDDGDPRLPCTAPSVAAMWGPHTVNLSLPSGASAANAINNSNIVVGIASGHGVKWDTSGHLTDLNTLMAAQLPAKTVITGAYKITDGGKILVSAYNGTAVTYYQLTPAIPNSIKISSNINPSSYGQPIHLVASVIPSQKSAPVPQGALQWYDNGKLLGSAGLTAIGTSSWEPSTWAPGKHTITVSYAGYSPNASGTSAGFSQTINVASTKMGLSASATTITHGQSVKLTATVVPSFGTIAGTVTFKNGSTILGTATVNGSTKQATLSPVLKTAGKYSITASYAATANYAGSTSSAVSVTVK
jgi:hypothetical protein